MVADGTVDMRVHHLRRLWRWFVGNCQACGGKLLLMQWPGTDLAPVYDAYCPRCCPDHETYPERLLR